MTFALETVELREALLGWYDQHSRTLPWRNHSPNPYHVWLSEVMLQQTTVPTVIPYFYRFIERWPTLQHLAAANINEILQIWQGLGYYSRAHNLHRCAQILSAQGFPKTSPELEKLPGIGPYTAAAIASIAFGEATVPVDGNVIRVMSRLGAIAALLPQGKKEIGEFSTLFASSKRPGDFAQALMDLGSNICKPRSPLCADCPLQFGCQAFGEGNPASYPVKLAKPEKPSRYGVVFVIERISDGALWLENPSSDRRLLKGLYQLPTSSWSEGVLETSDAPLEGLWSQDHPVVKHTFTHFHLFLKPLSLKTLETPSGEGQWVLKTDLGHYPLSTLMRKVIAVL